MQYTIHGFSQQEALRFKKTVIDNKGKEKEIKVDCTDLLILRWFVDFYSKMTKVEIEGVQYAWVRYEAILKDLPLLDIKKRALADRLKKLSEFKILKCKTIKKQGTFSYYGFGEMYNCLIDTESSQLHNGVYSTTEGVVGQPTNGSRSTNQGVVGQPTNGSRSTNQGVVGQPTNKDLSTKYLSTKYILIDENFEKLWKMLEPTPYDRKTKVTKKRKKELYEMGEERTRKAIELYLKVQDSQYYYKRDNFFNEIINNFIDKEESDFKQNGKGKDNGQHEKDLNIDEIPDWARGTFI